MQTLTVFTPTYNRKDMLGRVYDSLKDQTCKDFEWLIVDDGSTDGTEDAVKTFKKDGIINIRYYKRENGGKMRAHNDGVKHTETPLFVCLDSDDYFTKTAVDDILRTWENADDKDSLAGIVAHKGRSESEVLYDQEFPDIKRTTIFDLKLRGFNGETTLIFRTELLKKYLFPEIEREKYVPEDYVYDLIGQEKELLVCPKILTVCEIVESGYTDSVEKLRWDNPTGWYLYYVNRARFAPKGVLKLKYAAHCLRFSLLADDSYKRENPLPLSLVLAGLPGAILLSLRRKL